MDAGVALAVGLFGGGSVLAFAQYLISRHDSKNDKYTTQLNRIEKKVDYATEKADRTELAGTRLQLFFLMIMQPKNRDTILQTAHRYFIELDGNGEAWDAFTKWASDNGVNIDYYKEHMHKVKLIKEERKLNGNTEI